MGEFFAKAFASNDKRIKGLSLLEQTKLLANSQFEQPSSNEAPSDAKIKENMALLKEFFPELAQGCFNDVQNALAYTLWILKTQNTKNSLNNIDKILNNTNLPLLSYMEPHGPLCQATLLFIQGICFELKYKIAAEEGNSNNQEIYSLQAKNKFINCCEIMLEIENKLNLKSKESKKNIAFMSHMRSYSRRFFDEACERGEIKEDIRDLVEKYHLNLLAESSDPDEFFAEMRERNRRRALNLSV